MKDGKPGSECVGLAGGGEFCQQLTSTAFRNAPPLVASSHELACRSGETKGVQIMTHSQMLGKFEYTGGPIFKVVLEC